MKLSPRREPEQIGGDESMAPFSQRRARTDDDDDGDNFPKITDVRDDRKSGESSRTFPQNINRCDIITPQVMITKI